MQTVIIGLDAFDPATFESLLEQGRLPNLSKYVERDSYRRLTVSNPAQSEVSWTSIATGLNPGGHGMFDFVHRIPQTYELTVSLLPMQRKLGSVQFVPPFTARTIFDQCAAQGYPATALWWPAMFPARIASPVRTIPGLGTPDLLGRLGVGTWFTTDSSLIAAQRKIPVHLLKQKADGRLEGALQGPSRKKLLGKSEAVTVPFTLRKQTGGYRLQLNGQPIDLHPGVWSPIVTLSFKMGRLLSIKALTRFILNESDSQITLYALPLQIHPLKTAWRYGTPRAFVKETWNNGGPFLTLGWPQDTTALEEGIISDAQFLALCDTIFARREKALMHHLANFEEGVLAAVFDSADRVQHMFLQQRPAIVERWYEKLDGLVGRVESLLLQRGLLQTTRLVILSDHGFTQFDHKVHLNRWLIERGYLTPAVEKVEGDLSQANWHNTKAYALGLNSLYLNLAGREGSGIVQPEAKAPLLRQLCHDLQRWQGPDGRAVVAQALPASEAFDGPLVEHAPDIVVGYSRGYRASQDTGLGKWGARPIVPNQDRWRADHCIDPQAVPGVIFSNHASIRDYAAPSYRDIPALTIDRAPDAGGSAPPPTGTISGEDQQALDERLKGLGYL